MRAGPTLWGRELDWLREIPSDLDLIETDDDAWDEARGRELLRTAVRSTLGRGRGVAVATKLLHLKRPRLFPILDAFVAQMLGRPITREDVDGRAEQAGQLIVRLRREGRRNAYVLRTIGNEFAAAGLERSLVRILYAALWLAHPAAGGPGARRRFTVELLP